MHKVHIDIYPSEIIIINKKKNKQYSVEEVLKGFRRVKLGVSKKRKGNCRVVDVWSSSRKNGKGKDNWVVVRFGIIFEREGGIARSERKE